MLTIEDKLDLRRLIKLDDMVRDTGRADRFGLVMVDACRDNPFEAVLARSLRRARDRPGRCAGSAAPVVPPRVLVAYATGATQTAADGTGRNSPFTAAVLKHLGEPDDVRLVIGKIVDAVAEASQQRQRPDLLGLARRRADLPGASRRLWQKRSDVQLTLAERKAVQRSLVRVGLYGGAEDGRFSPTVRRVDPRLPGAIGCRRDGISPSSRWWRSTTRPASGGSPAPLPPIDIIDVLRRSEAGERDTALLRAKLFDRAYMAGPLPKDMTEAARWYRKAAEAGDAEAPAGVGQDAAGW